jgi:hypothetical protein
MYGFYGIEQERRCEKTIDELPLRHPFEIRYDKIESIDWESCAKVLDGYKKKQHLLKGW